MNVIIVAVCVNIALVNANNDIDLDTIIRIIKGRRFTNTPKRADEPIEAMRIIPGFYLETPKSVSKSLSKYAITKHNDVYGRYNMADTNRHEKKQTRDTNSDSRNDYLTAKILKAVKSLDRFRSKKKYEQPKERSSKGDKLLVEKLLANLIIGENNINSFQEQEKYDESLESDPTIKSKTAATLLVEKLLANILNEVETNYAIEDSETYKYGTTNENIWSSGSRYENILQQILEAVQNSKQYHGQEKDSPLIIVETKPKTKLLRTQQKSTEDTFNDKQTLFNSDTIELENNAHETLDDLFEDEGFEDTYPDPQHDTRRSRNCSDDEFSVSKEGSSEQEKNPGNPFTVHKNKYKQNWPWNHYMDGDHMNINPFGPQFASLGPSGPELFFGRKWWYFNQDDYKPMG